MVVGIMRGIVAFIVSAILGGVCLVFGFAPDEWIAAVIAQPPLWLLHPLTRVGAVAAGGLFGVLAWKFWPWRSARKTKNANQQFPTADLDEWRKVDPLELWRAGCLWKGFQPHDQIGFNDPAYASYIMLVNAAKAGQLAVTNPGNEVDAWSLVNRSELARFARV